jgi:cyclic nucleotide-binding protein
VGGAKSRTFKTEQLYGGRGEFQVFNGPDRKIKALSCQGAFERKRIGVKAKNEKEKEVFQVDAFLAEADGGRSVLNFRKNQRVFSQGDPADAVYFMREGKVKVSVVSELGKEAVVAIHDTGDFFGEGCLRYD